MSLVDFWKSSPDQIRSKTIEQLLTFAGDGKLRDGNETSAEFRQFLGHIPSDLLSTYAVQCLTSPFHDGGLALQDIVNQAGRRLGFKVEDGRYRGTAGEAGFDGIWRTAEGDAILAEVKTTDVYRLSLDTTAKYRRDLIKNGAIPEESSSILYVVGRSGTGELEAQVRGSRHAWDIRLISVDALFRLVKIKEELEDQNTIGRIRAILVPQEFTRVDDIIDLVFNATKEVQPEEIEEDEEDEGERTGKKFTFVPVQFRDACITRLQSHLGESLVKQTAAVYATPNGDTGVLCAISKEHHRSNRVGYWFAFHPSQRFYTNTRRHGLHSVADLNAQSFSFRSSDFLGWLPLLNRTDLEERFYWHVQIAKECEKFRLNTKRGHDDVDLTPYLLKSPPDGSWQ
jgi:hypothetical protein